MKQKQDRTTPIYKVWLHERDQPEEDAKEYGAIDVERAAQVFCDYGHNDWGWETTFPITVRVRDPDGKLWDVTVDRDVRPVYRPSKPVPV